MLRKGRPSEHPRYFRVTAVRPHTVPIVEKFVERAKAVREWSASQRQGTDLIVQPKPAWSKSLCCHCGESGSTSYMFGLDELREKSLTDGHTCYPICTDCMADRKGMAKHRNQDNVQARKEKKERTMKGESENSQREIKRHAEEQEQYNLWCAINSKPHSFSVVSTVHYNEPLGKIHQGMNGFTNRRTGFANF